MAVCRWRSAGGAAVGFYHGELQGQVSSPETTDDSKDPKPRDVFQRIGDFFYGATIGLLKEYQEKSIDLAKLAAAAAYVHSIKTLRKYCLYLLAAFLMLTVLAFSIVVVPLAFITLGPWSANAKLIALACFATAYLVIPMFLLKDFLSEKKWLQISRSEKILSNLTDDGSSD